MPVKDQAAYMREYRAKRKALATGEVPFAASLPVLRAAFDDAQRVVFLEAEVARLKRELAQRPASVVEAVGALSDRVLAARASAGYLPTFGHSSPAPKPAPKGKR